MAVTLQCARCMHEQKIDDDKAEKGVPCKICHNLIKPAAKSKSSTAKGIKKDEGIKSGPPSARTDKQTAIADAKSNKKAPEPRRR